MPIDYESARSLLESSFSEAEGAFLSGNSPTVHTLFRDACEVLFHSRTQAYREVLLGCLIARIQDKSINIHQPYTNQGPSAFSGRGLDERVINPFLQDKGIPSSRGPYLSVFRRSVHFDSSIHEGLRDKEGFDALLNALDYVVLVYQENELLEILRHLLYRFVELREQANLPLSRLQRMSLEQYDRLVAELLNTPSGGRFPVLLVVATFKTINEFFNQNWTISWQGINVADAPSGAGGDITITRDGQTLMSAEVTERPVNQSRVTTTFNTKIAPAGIEDYLFFVRPAAASPEALHQARQYFAQGHEINFLDIKQWILMSLATMGKGGRGIFNGTLLQLMGEPDVPSALKVHWNDQIARIASGHS